MKRKNNLIVAILLITTVFSSCSKMIEVDPPKNQVVTAQVFADSAGATAAVLSLYIRMMNSPFIISYGNGGITIYTGLTSDELLSTRNNPSEIEFHMNSISSDNSLVSQLWKEAYTIIFQANSVIEGISISEGIGNSLKEQLLGEARLIRALTYFNLINLFGDVPLVRSTAYSLNSQLSRTSKDSIYSFIVSDLEDVRQNMPLDFFGNLKIRPSQHAVMALQARIYLYLGKWVEAEMVSSEIIESGYFELVNDLNEVFLPGSSEIIWQIPPVMSGGFETTEGMQFVPFFPNTLPNFIISDHLYNSFETVDKRRMNWIGSSTVNGDVYYFPYKYKLGYSGNAVPNENYCVFRLAEQYLIRAEAKAHQGEAFSALSDLNIIRQRAGLSVISSTDQASLLNAILEERKKEFFCEWGNRWYDIKRNNMADQILGIIKAPDWQSSDQLFPIPFREIILNPNLQQNPGY